jgi:hypothetical protein
VDYNLLYKINLLSRFTVKNLVIIFKVDVPLPQAYVTIDDFGYHVYAILFSCPQRLLNYLVFKYFDLVYQIRVVCIKFDIKKLLL